MKRTRIRAISKRDDRTLEMKADRMWQIKVLLRAKGRCEGPHCRAPATVGHHIVGRTNKVTRHILNNGMAYCAKCHDWAHREPRVQLALLKILFPERYKVWEWRFHLLAMPYPLWIEERMKELTP